MMTDETSLANGNALADERVALNFRKLPDCHPPLDLHEWPNKRVVSYRAPVKIYEILERYFDIDAAKLHTFNHV